MENVNFRVVVEDYASPQLNRLILMTLGFQIRYLLATVRVVASRQLPPHQT